MSLPTPSSTPLDSFQGLHGRFLPGEGDGAYPDRICPVLVCLLS